MSNLSALINTVKELNLRNTYVSSSPKAQPRQPLDSPKKLSIDFSLLKNRDTIETLVQQKKLSTQGLMRVKAPSESSIKTYSTKTASLESHKPSLKNLEEDNNEEKPVILQIEDPPEEEEVENQATFNLAGAQGYGSRLGNNSDQRGPNYIRSAKKPTLSNTMKATHLNIPNPFIQLAKLQGPTGNYCPSPSQSKRNLSLSMTPKAGSCGPLKTEVEKTTPVYSSKSSNTVLEYSYREDQNKAYKEAMEDKGKSIDNFNYNNNNALFSIYDGHGGDLVSKYLQKNFDKRYRRVLAETDIKIEDALKTTFLDINDEILNMKLETEGSTGCVVHVIKPSVSTLLVYCANVGDTRCSLISPTKIKRLSYDHKASDENEKKRIIQMGGNIENDRVDGQLMVTRAFGDYELKDMGVIADPYITKTQIDLNDKNQFLILACDGIWDVLTEKDIQNIIMFNNNTVDLCQNILKSALQKDAWDNLSLFVVKLT